MYLSLSGYHVVSYALHIKRVYSYKLHELRRICSRWNVGSWINLFALDETGYAEANQSKQNNSR